MRVLLPLIALVLTAAAGPPQSGGRPQMGELRVPSRPGEAVCRDRIQEVRDERGLPRLDRETASPDEALLIAAVDKRIGGCAVMVMRNDTSDIRPLPAPQEHRMMPAR